MCTLSVQLYSDVRSVNSVFVSYKIINNSDNFRVKCLSYSEISAILCVLYFLFFHFLFDFGKHVKQCEKISFSLLYLTLVTSCTIGPFLCCLLLCLIIYLILLKIYFFACPIHNGILTRKLWFSLRLLLCTRFRDTLNLFPFKVEK